MLTYKQANSFTLCYCVKPMPHRTPTTEVIWNMCETARRTLVHLAVWSYSCVLIVIELKSSVKMRIRDKKIHFLESNNCLTLCAVFQWTYMRSERFVRGGTPRTLSALKMARTNMMIIPASRFSTAHSLFSTHSVSEVRSLCMCGSKPFVSQLWIWFGCLVFAPNVNWDKLQPPQ